MCDVCPVKLPMIYSYRRFCRVIMKEIDMTEKRKSGDGSFFQIPREIIADRKLIFNLLKMILKHVLQVLISVLSGRLFSRLLQFWFIGLYLIKP